jgi:hypothetical protein
MNTRSSARNAASLEHESYLVSKGPTMLNSANETLVTPACVQYTKEVVSDLDWPHYRALELAPSVNLHQATTAENITYMHCN